MNEEQMKEAISEAVSEAFSVREQQSCRLDIDRADHEEEHQFIRGLMGVADRLDSIKWDFLRSGAKAVGSLLVIAIVMGLLVLAKIKGAELP